jgi:hypothetical protein
MAPASDIVRKLFEDYERGIGAPDPELISGIYEDSFVFAGLGGCKSSGRRISSVRSRDGRCISGRWA